VSVISEPTVHLNVRLVHHPADGAGERVLATDVDVADSAFARARGLMFRSSIPEGYALWFPFGRADSRTLHMLFVPFAIDAVWLVDDTVTAVKRLVPFVGLGRARADSVVELPAGAATDVDVGDRIERRQ